MRGELLLNEPLSNYTSWRIGGPAKQAYKPADVDDLRFFLQQLPAEESILWLGLGSNALVPDEGFDGTVIFTQGLLNQIEMIDPVSVKAQSGVACAAMARFCARANLEGLEFLAGIPGTLGGALKMNAGCYNGETWDFVKSVETIDRQGQLQIRFPSDYAVEYRHVQGPDEWFISATFELRPGEKEKSLSVIKELLARRASTQPTSEPSCGSVFRNPSGDYAARLIEASGLKGYRIGDAEVSTKHANFIINRGHATAQDIKQLIDFVMTTVHAQQGILLQREVHYIEER